MNSAAMLGTIIRHLVDARRAIGMTQQQLADAMGKSRETISRWETWETWPSLGDAVAWAGWLGCEIAVTGPVTPTQPAE